MAVCNVHFRTPSWFERHGSTILTVVAIAGIAALASVLRFWQLGLRTFTDDESIYSLVSRQLARGGGYEQVTELHGPLQFALTAAAFKLFGETDSVARLMPALFGVLLAMLPFAFTRHIGKPGAIAAALLLAISPTILYYSRFAGPDVYLAFFTLATAMVIWRYLVAPDRAYLYLLALTLAFAVVSSEMALAGAPIFVVFLAYRVGTEFIGQAGEPRAVEHARTHYELLGVAPNTTVREIRLAYKKLIDRTSARDERERMANAYHVLTTPVRREAYDRKVAQHANAIAGADATPVAGTTFVARIVLLGGGWLFALAWPFAGIARRRLNLKSLPEAANPMIVVLLLMLPFYGPLAEKLPFVGDRGFDTQRTIVVIGGSNITPGGELPVMLITLGLLFAVAGVLGFAWKWHAWVIVWAAFYGVVVTLFTGFFSHESGLWTGLWGTLDYWSRPEVHSAAGPPYYYGMLLGAYEFLPLIAIACGVVVLIATSGWRNRAIIAVAAVSVTTVSLVPAWTPFVAEHRFALAAVIICSAVLALRLRDLTKFLAFWTAAAFCAFTIIGRKDPWLSVHVALPAILLSATLFNDAILALEMPALAMPRFRVYAPRRLAQGLVAASLGVFAVFSLRVGVLAGWGHGDVPQLAASLASRDHGDTPIELLNVNQNAPDVREVARAITQATASSPKGRDTEIALDSSFGFGAGWEWYLRDYANITVADMRKPYQVPVGAIVLVDTRNRANVLGDDGALTLTFTKRWSFPGRYDGLSQNDVASRLVSTDSWAQWYRYLSDRTTVGQPQYSEGVLYVPRDLSASVTLPRQSDVLSSAIAPGAGTHATQPPAVP